MFNGVLGIFANDEHDYSTLPHFSARTRDDYGQRQRFLEVPLSELLPLIRLHQEFYKIEDISHSRNNKW